MYLGRDVDKGGLRGVEIDPDIEADCQNGMVLSGARIDRIRPEVEFGPPTWDTLGSILGHSRGLAERERLLMDG